MSWTRKCFCFSISSQEDDYICMLDKPNFHTDKDQDVLETFYLLSREKLDENSGRGCVTLTGYGQNVPLSDGGKAFCLFYSGLGIPATLVFLSALVERIMVLVTSRPLSYLHLRWKVSKPTLAAVHAAWLSFVAALLLFLLPAAVFCRLEPQWSYMESLYFCFISLTTIGLGDYLPGETQSTIPNTYSTVYKLGITLYLLLGLVCLLVVVETCWELPQVESFTRSFYREQEYPESEHGDQEELKSTEHD